MSVMPAQKHIIPERSELLLGHMISCSEPGCSSIFKSQSNLTLHLRKIHKKNVSLSFRKELNQVYFYYCPESNCIYNHSKNLEEKKNYFTELKHLKQHFQKVHKEKEFQCSNCKKAFPDTFSLKRHLKVCGQKFYCGICGSTYKNQTSLIHHVKQKGHVFEMSDYDQLFTSYGEAASEVIGMKHRKKGKAKTHQAIQTEQTKTKKRPAITQTIQTLARTNKKCKTTSSDIDTGQTSQKLEAASTQTLPIDFNNLFDDLSQTYADNSSQTSHDLVSYFHMETQTEQLSTLSNFTLEEISDSSNNDPLLFNHIQTQTTDELLEDTCYDIHTQTHFDTEFDYSDYQELVSTETQTYIPRSNLYVNNSSSYTQTSQSIEGLDQIDTTFNSIHTQT